MIKLENHILAIAKNQNITVNRNQLQKVMYFTIFDSMENFRTLQPLIKKIYTEQFEAWDYGPTLRSSYKNRPMRVIYDEGEYFYELAVFDKIILKRLNQHFMKLVEEAHEHSTGKENKEKILKRETLIKYSLYDIYKDYHIIKENIKKREGATK